MVLEQAIRAVSRREGTRVMGPPRERGGLESSFSFAMGMPLGSLRGPNRVWFESVGPFR